MAIVKIFFVLLLALPVALLCGYLFYQCAKYVSANSSKRKKSRRR